MSRGYTVTELAYEDHVLETVELPGGTLRVTFGLGSGLSRSACDPPDRLWAIGDRGPNLKIGQAVEDYGLDHLRPLLAVKGAKIMPSPSLGPAIAELRIEGDRVALSRIIRLTRPDGALLSGLPLPGGGEAEMEPALDLSGERLPADGGADTEGLAALADGGFWVADEYGPSLLRVDPAGLVLWRWTPEGAAGPSDPPFRPILPALAARRRLNRGFEGIAVSADEAWLYVAFQSPLSHPDDATGEAADQVRIWKIEAASGVVAAQYAYLLDPPETFRRDAEAGPVAARDRKICELAWIGEDRLLVLERMSRSGKIYRVDLSGCELPQAHLDLAWRPTLEETSPDGSPVVAKRLLLSTDDARTIGPDLEGMAVIGDRELVLVTDNDFGIEGVETRFFRVRFDAPFAEEGPGES